MLACERQQFLLPMGKPQVWRNCQNQIVPMGMLYLQNATRAILVQGYVMTRFELYFKSPVEKKKKAPHNFRPIHKIT